MNVILTKWSVEEEEEKNEIYEGIGLWFFGNELDEMKMNGIRQANEHEFKKIRQQK